MFRAVVNPQGQLQLGDQAERAGYAPGAVVDVLVTRAGQLIVTLADDLHTTVDVEVRPLVGGAAQLALRRGGSR